MSTQPNLCAILSSWWGSGYDCGYAAGFTPNGSGIIVGTNPPYSVTDFFGMYPNFGGVPTAITGTVSNGSPVVAVSSPVGLAAGQLVVGAGIPGGATITLVAGSDITLSAPATADGATVPLTVYTAPFIPLTVLNVFIALASASLIQNRWKANWPLAMALFINHYATLWLHSNGSPASTAGQLVSAGLAIGITVSRSVGPASVSSQLIGLSALEQWGSWTLTLAGQQLITMARAIVAVPAMYVW